MPTDALASSPSSAKNAISAPQSTPTSWVSNPWIWGTALATLAVVGYGVKRYISSQQLSEEGRSKEETTEKALQAGSEQEEPSFVVGK